MGQLTETIQAMARGQEELRHAAMRVATVNPLVSLPVNQPVGTHPPLEGGPLNQNSSPTFKSPINTGG